MQIFIFFILLFEEYKVKRGVANENRRGRKDKGEGDGDVCIGVEMTSSRKFSS